jgi:hypothetical protein
LGHGFSWRSEARKTLTQIIGGVLVLAGLNFSLQTFSLQHSAVARLSSGPREYYHGLITRPGNFPWFWIDARLCAAYPLLKKPVLFT